MRPKYTNTDQPIPASHSKQTCLVVGSLLKRECTERQFNLPELSLLALYYLEYRRRGLNSNSDRWRWLKVGRDILRFQQYSETVFYPFSWVWNSIWHLHWSKGSGLTHFMQWLKLTLWSSLRLHQKWRKIKGHPGSNWFPINLNSVP